MPFQYPIFMRLREHHCVGDDLPLGWGQGVYEEEADGLPNAWFPPEVDLSEKDVSAAFILRACALEFSWMLICVFILIGEIASHRPNDE